MEVRHLRYFVAVAESGGFARAATQLHISQPALSKQIRDLEAELDVTLFDRSKRAIHVTQAGQYFLEDVQQILSQLERAQNRARRVQTGRLGALDIGLADSFSWHDAVTRSISAFRAEYPEVALNIEIMMSGEQLAAVRNGRLSAGFIVERPREDKDLNAIEILTDRLMLAVAKTSRFASHPPRRLSELSDVDLFVLPRKMNPGFHDRFVKACHDGGIGPRLMHEGMNDTANLSLVAAGLGCTFVPSEARWRKPKNIVLVPVGDLNVSITLEFVWHRENRQPTLRNFAQLLTHARHGSMPRRIGATGKPVKWK